MIDTTLGQIDKWNNNGLVLKHIRLDNASEKKKLQERAKSKDWKMNIDFEYTERYTPHHIYPEELVFLVLANKGIEMLYHGNFQQGRDIRYS